MKYTFVLLFLFVSLQVDTAQDNSRIIANPLNLNYRFQPDEPSRREAADPVIEYFKGKYYLFASKSGGYWNSTDLVKWNYIPCKTISTIENYAPTVLTLGDTLFYLASGSRQIHYTQNPDADEWKVLSSSRFEYSETDPAFFKDEITGKVYVYWGCSDSAPIYGVEVDPNKGFQTVGTPTVLIEHHPERYGWEVPGNSNNEERIGWNEGAAMLQYNGKYYLQYAAPGTEYRIYADGAYIGNSPLLPFTYMDNSPFSIKPGGFIGGAGHGHTFKDKYGNYWHVATMRICKRHFFERRIGLFPVYFDKNGRMCAHTVMTDYPFAVPDRKVDFAADDYSANWNLLSYKKTVSASSFLEGYSPENANNEEIENWWAAKTGKVGEWWKIDLGQIMQVNAIQINFADHDFNNKASSSYTFYQYIVEASTDGKNWMQIIDRRQNTADMPHELIILDLPQQTRYMRIINAKTLNGKFSMSGFRVFGQGAGKSPNKVTGLQVKRMTDKRRFVLNWNRQDNATGYIVRWGVERNQLNNAVMVFDNRLEAGFFNRDSEYWFTVDAFNENGITKGTSAFSHKTKNGFPVKELKPLKHKH
ncbi:MAG: family 43 glycosylhydrolase [Dysgonamonadaceae bacterium]|jgi:hypothetical protein|nr:family 43 glycosylhydrolase [Dysgonamonadaceae bacterium]